jgi:hypothetical protein
MLSGLYLRNKGNVKPASITSDEDRNQLNELDYNEDEDQLEEE